VSSTVDLDDVGVSYGRTEVVHGVSASIGGGEWVALIGPNGAGKTTLLRAIAGLVPFAGSIQVDCHDVGTIPRRELARRLALVPQNPSTPSELTVAEYVLLGRTPYIGYLSTEATSDRIAASEALGQLGLGAFSERRLGSLSGGELQRVVLARALAQDAPLLLLDEPTSALDLGRQQQVLELVDGLRRENRLTVISAMHDLSLAGQFADRLLLLDGGRLAASGTAAEVLSEETIGSLYAASVQIVHSGGAVYVLPRRRSA
jgi:iron complex transport system ATP-binding protein